MSANLSVKYLGCLIPLASCVLLAPLNAQACRSINMQQTLFFKAIPNPLPSAELIAEVTLMDVAVIDGYKGEAKANVLHLVKSASGRVHEGDILSLKFLVSSCGPLPQQGQKGTILAREEIDKDGRRVWRPYSFRNSDGMFWQPSSFEQR